MDCRCWWVRYSEFFDLGQNWRIFCMKFQQSANFFVSFVIRIIHSKKGKDYVRNFKK